MLLDTESETTIADSVASILELSRREVESVVRTTTVDYDSSFLPEQQIFERVKHKIKNRFDVSLYHATRSLDPNKFWKLGILRLDERISGIFDELREFFVEPFCSYSNDELHAFCLENSQMYSHRLGSARDFGPFAFLFREAIIHSKQLGYHDYFTRPEIVENIFDAIDPSGESKKLWSLKSYPAIVKFYISDDTSRYLGNALYYIKRKMKNGDYLRANTFYDAAGRSIESRLILDVETPEI